MSDSQDRIRIQLDISPSNPDVLEGLDYLLRLGLLSHEEVRQLCQESLTSPLPISVVTEAEPEPEPEIPPLSPSPPPPLSPSPPPRRRYIAQGIKSLMAELSVQWLLFLGVFMVTLSSGVLAATQWEQFPPFGQYLVLFAYSFLFWFASQWAIKQSNLSLTSQTLQTATMLLVPLNFWAMDGFGLWNSPLGWITATIAAMVLSGITINTYRNSQHAGRSSPLPWLNHIFLSFLHWGWGLSVFPLVAVYLGTIASSLTTFYQNPPNPPLLRGGFERQNDRQNPPGFERQNDRQNPPLVRGGKGGLNDRLEKTGNPTSYLLVLYSTAAILFRGIFLQGIEITQLGLAIGISGWLFVWLCEKKPAESVGDRDTADSVAAQKTVPVSPQLPLMQIGNFLLLAGWCISFFSIPWGSDIWQPWEALQAFGVSGLALWLLFRRFFGSFQRRDLIAIFFIGLQACLLFRQIIPPGLRSQAVKTGVELAQAADAPFTIYAITLIPYLLLTVWFTDWIYRHDKSNITKCGQTGDLLSLFLAVTMACLSLPNVNVRSLNLIATTIILSAITYRRLTSGIGLPNTNDGQNPMADPPLLRGGLEGQNPMADPEGNEELNDRQNPPLLRGGQGGFPPVTTPTSVILLYLTHLAGLLTGASLIDLFFPNLSGEIWGAICLGAMVVEWALYIWAERVNQKAKQNETPIPYVSYFLEQTSYYFGLSLAALSYYLFALIREVYAVEQAIDASRWMLVWLIAPISLTVVAAYSKKKRTMATCFSTIALVMANSMLLQKPVLQLIGFGIATIIMFVNTGYLRHTVLAAITVGFALGFEALVLDFGIFGLPKLVGMGWFLPTAITIAGLVVLHKQLTAKIAKQKNKTEKIEKKGKRKKKRSLAEVYAPAVNGWAIFLSTGLLIFLTLHSVLLYVFYGDSFLSVNPNVNTVIATTIVTGAIAYRNFPVFNNPSIYILAWCLEILAAELLAFFDKSVLILAIANIVLGLATQLLGDWWFSQGKSTDDVIPRSWHIIPLMYGGLGAIFRSGTLTSWTGLTTLGLAFTAIGVGRRSRGGKFLIYLALVGVWLSAYEVLYYQISALGTGDQLVAIAALTASLLYAYRILTPWLTHYLKLTEEELTISAHIHWVVASSVLIAAIAYPIAVNMLLGIGTGILLARYAIMQGRHNPYVNIAETWVYLGLLETAALLAYGVTKLPEFWFDWVLAWAGAIATIVAYFFYFIPWKTWGWPLEPWRRSAIILPITSALIFGGNILATTFVPSSLLIPAGFYIFLAWFHRRSANSWRFTYLSGLLIDWALLRWFVQLNFTEPLWYVMPVALLILYIAQVDPALKQSAKKQVRHTIRLVGSGAICVVALFTANWLITGLITLVAIFAGLALRVRAYLYVGTVVFLLNATYQMVILSYEHPQLKWAIGLLVGIAFIWIAATFERSRQQIILLVKQAISELENWE